MVLNFFWCSVLPYQFLPRFCGEPLKPLFPTASVLRQHVILNIKKKDIHRFVTVKQSYEFNLKIDVLSISSDLKANCKIGQSLKNQNIILLILDKLVSNDRWGNLIQMGL